MKGALFRPAFLMHVATANRFYADGLGLYVGPRIATYYQENPHRRPTGLFHIAEAMESFVIALLKCRNESKDKIHRSCNCTFK